MFLFLAEWNSLASAGSDWPVFAGSGPPVFGGIRLEGSVYQAAMGNLGDFAVKEKLNAVFGRVFPPCRR